MGKLMDYQRDNSAWLRLTDGENINVKYLGYEFVINKTGKKVPCYKFKTLEGKEKMLSSQSGFLCAFFDETDGEAKVGDTVSLTRIGEGTDTKYNATVENNIIV